MIHHFSKCKFGRWAVLAMTTGIIVIFSYWLVVLFFMVIVAPVVLFFEQDYHPWQESMGDLAAFGQNTPVLLDTPELSQLAPTAATQVQGCSAFREKVRRQPSVLVSAQTYCKIRVWSACGCTEASGTDPNSEVLVKVHITRGPHRGKDAWICRSAIGLTVAPL